jgi:hypothetical protein
VDLEHDRRTVSASHPDPDRFHAKQHLSDVGKIIYSANSEERRQWIQQRYDELDEGRIEPLLQALDQRALQYDEARKCAEYFRHNRERIRYPEFHAQGLCTATGVVEAGCKVAIGTRLKRFGMHWTESGANAIIALRCSKLSGRYEDFWERRSGSQRLAA